MRRDDELVRRIVRARGDAAPGQKLTVEHLAGDDYDPAVVIEHIRLLIDADLIDGSIVRTMGGRPPHVQIGELTWKGQEFLAAADNDTVWARTKAVIRDRGGSASFAVLQQLLTSAAQQQFGLPG